MPDPRAGLRVTEEPHGPEPVLIYAQHPRAGFIHVGQRQNAGLVQRGTDRPPRHPERRGGLGHGPPERIAASTKWSLSRPVERARRGTWAVDSKKESRAQAGSSQCQRYLDQRTSTAPATGMSRIRWERLSFRRVATTPQVGQPGGWSVSTMIRRLPSATTVAEMTW